MYDYMYRVVHYCATYYAIAQHLMSSYVKPYHNMTCHTIPYHAMVYHTMPCNMSYRYWYPLGFAANPCSSDGQEGQNRPELRGLHGGLWGDPREAREGQGGAPREGKVSLSLYIYTYTHVCVYIYIYVHIYIYIYRERERERERAIHTLYTYTDRRSWATSWAMQQRGPRQHIYTYTYSHSYTCIYMHMYIRRRCRFTTGSTAGRRAAEEGLEQQGHGRQDTHII